MMFDLTFKPFQHYASKVADGKTKHVSGFSLWISAYLRKRNETNCKDVEVVMYFDVSKGSMTEICERWLDVITVKTISETIWGLDHVECCLLRKHDNLVEPKICIFGKLK